MPVGTKLSQIAPALAPPALTDVVVGVQSPSIAPVDLLYTWQQIGSALVAPPVNAVQFNNPLGTFAGTVEFTWTTGNSTVSAPRGLQLGSATGSAHPAPGFITPGPNSEHVAIGNWAVIDNPVFAPGDLVNQGAVGVSVGVLNICDHFITSTDTAERAGIGDDVAITYNGGGIHQGFQGIDINVSINSDSTGPFAIANGGSITINNFGSGNVQTLLGVLCECTNSSAAGQGVLGGEFFGTNAASGTLSSNLIGGVFVAQQQGTNPNQTIGGWFRTIIQNTTPTAIAGKFENWTLSNTTTLSQTIWVKAPVGGGTITNHYGLYIDDHSGFGTTISENIHSFGAGSINNFEGYVITKGRLVAALAAPSAALAGARSFVTDSNLAMAGNFGAIVAGLGGNAVPVVCDGTNWRIG